MRTDPLVGSWRLEGTSSVITLRDDGRAIFHDDSDKEIHGHWHRIDHDQFETIQPVDDPAGSRRHHQPSHFSLIRRVAEFGSDRLRMEIIRSSDGDFDYDPEVWLRIES